MPLPATLRGYRIGGRFVWNVLLDQRAVDPRLISVQNDVGQILEGEL